MKPTVLYMFFVLAFVVSIPLVVAAVCEPTAADALGPFYKPGAPERSKVGDEYTLSGVVRGTDCSPIAGARIELWLAGPDGRYDDDYRATVASDGSGAYSFESNFPPAYMRRPPHIHIRVSVPGFNVLVTQHYPAKGSTRGVMDLVLVPSRDSK
jgi:protocatechuate 3,4-dioxygenase beta subunit